MKPPKNFRYVIRRICSNCKMLKYDDGGVSCKRPDGPDWDSGDRMEELHTCDRWKNRFVK
jgi:hypothetical protein